MFGDEHVRGAVFNGGPLWKLGARVVVIPATPRRGLTSTLAVTAAGWIAPDSVASVAVDG